MEETQVQNPFKPGTGHSPLYLAGREPEKEAFKKLLKQTTILSNLLLTGLRGVGKTVLLEDLKPIAIAEKWLWVGTDLSESTSVNEEALSKRLIADLSTITSGITISENKQSVGFSESIETITRRLNYETLLSIHNSVGGLAADKLKFTLEFVWNCLSQLKVKGVVFAYDEAQTMSDHAEKDQYPLSLLLDVFQSIQRKQIPFMLAMVGLPTLFPKLVETRTYSERMFSVQLLGKLNEKDSRAAITKPIEQSKAQIKFNSDIIDLIYKTSSGYPYFIQFICKEMFDLLQQKSVNKNITNFDMDAIIKKLDKDFFASRWANATDRQRELLLVISRLDHCDEEFAVQEIVSASRALRKPFSPSHVNQMLVTLGNSGLVYKNRHGRYAFAVPLLGQFINRQEAEDRQLYLPLEKRR